MEILHFFKKIVFAVEDDVCVIITVIIFAFDYSNDYMNEDIKAFAVCLNPLIT